jgi:hypothetical protein
VYTYTVAFAGSRAPCTAAGDIIPARLQLHMMFDMHLQYECATIYDEKQQDAPAALASCPS